MKTIALVLTIILAACGGSQAGLSGDTSTETASVPDVSGNYTFNEYLIAPFDSAQIGQTGKLTVTQNGSQLTATATLAYPVPFPSSLSEIRRYSLCQEYTGVFPDISCSGHDIATDTAQHSWTGSVTVEVDGSVTLRLTEASTTPDGRPNGLDFTAQRDPSGNLRGECHPGIDSIRFLTKCEGLR